MQGSLFTHPDAADERERANAVELSDDLANVAGADAELNREQRRRLLDVQTIYMEPAIEEHARGREILAKFPDAERIPVESHWKIPHLHGNEGLVEDWVQIKRTVLVLGVKKSLSATPYSRSCDFVAPSHASGCAMACSYCYVPRRKGFANPITTFVNIEGMTRYLKRHAAKQGFKATPTQADSCFWVYELGSNSDCSADALISDNIRDLVSVFRETPNAKATFATKFVNRDLLTYDPQGKTRIRFSLLPQRIARVVDVRTSPVAERIAAINDFARAGYETNINFGPVIVHDDWLRSYTELFREIDDTLSDEAKRRMTCEVIFLTHNEGLHQINLGWHPQGEELLWRPEMQEQKISETGGVNVRYKIGMKRKMVGDFVGLLNERLPWCKVRYAF